MFTRSRTTKKLSAAFMIFALIFSFVPMAWSSEVTPTEAVYDFNKDGDKPVEFTVTGKTDEFTVSKVEVKQGKTTITFAEDEIAFSGGKLSIPAKTFENFVDGESEITITTTNVLCHKWYIFTDKSPMEIDPPQDHQYIIWPKNYGWSKHQVSVEDKTAKSVDKVVFFGLDEGLKDVHLTYGTDYTWSDKYPPILVAIKDDVMNNMPNGRYEFIPYENETVNVKLTIVNSPNKPTGLITNPVFAEGAVFPTNVEKDTATAAAEKSYIDSTAPVFADSIDKISSTGVAYIKTDTAKEILVKTLASENVEQVTSLPIFKATMKESLKVGSIAINLKGSEIIPTATTVEEIKIFKLVSNTASLEYKQIDNTEDAEDGTFIVLDSKGNNVAGNIDAEKTYQVVMFIKDNGDYDLDKTAGVILDPAELVKTSAKEEPKDDPTTGGSSGGGGCNTGFGAMALLALLPLLPRGITKKRK